MPGIKELEQGRKSEAGGSRASQAIFILKPVAFRVPDSQVPANDFKPILSCTKPFKIFYNKARRD